MYSACAGATGSTVLKPLNSVRHPSCAGVAASAPRLHEPPHRVREQTRLAHDGAQRVERAAIGVRAGACPALRLWGWWQHQRQRALAQPTQRRARAQRCAQLAHLHPVLDRAHGVREAVGDHACVVARRARGVSGRCGGPPNQLSAQAHAATRCSHEARLLRGLVKRPRRATRRAERSKRAGTGHGAARASQTAGRHFAVKLGRQYRRGRRIGGHHAAATGGSGAAARAVTGEARLRRRSRRVRCAVPACRERASGGDGGRVCRGGWRKKAPTAALAVGWARHARHRLHRHGPRPGAISIGNAVSGCRTRARCGRTVPRAT